MVSTKRNAAPPPHSLFFHRSSGVNQTNIDCGRNNVKLTILLTFSKYWGVTYESENAEKYSTVDLYSEFSCKS